MRPVLLSVMLALLLLAGRVSAVAAMEEWCEDDPPVLILTPGGSVVPVFVTNAGLGLQHLPAVQLARISYTVQPIQAGSATLVKMQVVVPGDVFAPHFATSSAVSTGAWATGVVYGSASGFSGDSMATTFELRVP